MKKQSNLSRLMGYAGEHRYFTYASWILSAVSALIALVPFWYIWRIIREVLTVAPDFAKAQNLAGFGWAAVGWAVVSVLIYIAGLMCSHIAAFRVASNLRKETMARIVTLPLGAVEAFGSGRLRKIVNESSAATETYLAHQLPDKAGAIATPIGLLVFLFAFDWKLGLLSLVPLALGFCCMFLMAGPSMQKRMEEYQNALDDMSNQAVEYVRGIPVVKTFGQTVFSFKKFKGSIDRYGKWVIAYTISLRLPMTLYTTAINGVFAVLVAAALMMTRDGVTMDFLLNLLLYIIVTPIIGTTMTKIMFMSENGMIVADAMKRIDSVLEQAPLPQTAAPKPPADSSVELTDVSFSYDGQTDVLKHISLRIEPGQTVAFVGPSGGGKTTLANLMARFFDPKGGSIRIGGVNLKDISQKELMETVSYVFQDSRLIKGTILENVRLAKPDAGRDEVLETLYAAQCGDILEKLPQGVDTVIGTGGIYLSGGEQQRVAIARAMLKNAPVVILDEATAFADPDNETRVQAAFNALAERKTVIMIAHRLSTVVNADQIFVIQDGQIAESGTCQELRSSGGLFAQMWKDYQTSIDWKVASK